MSGGTLAGVCLLSFAFLGETGGDETPSPETSAYEVEGLEEEAEILVDRWGVPHMYASSLRDVSFVQGFNAARDRLWQIDLWRRRGLGKLSEVLGAGYVEKDRAARLFLYRGDMEEEWSAYGPDAELMATGFAEGINEYIELTEREPALLPVEFGLLDYAPERWSPEDVVRIRSHGLSRNVESEVARALILRDFGPEVEDLRQRLEPDWETEVPDGLDLASIPDDVLRVYELATEPVEFSPSAVRAPGAPIELPDVGTVTVEETPGNALSRLIERLRKAAGIGSNNWAISPERTGTGRPILASDPHREYAVPALRYISHLSTPEMDVIGAGEPSLPGVSIGHNGEIAFGLTIFAIDQEDLYVYETNPANPSEYLYEGAWEAMEMEAQSITVREGGSHGAELKFTRHGPVIYEDPARNLAFAVRTAWLEPGAAPYFGSIGYMRAGSWEEFLECMEGWGVPAENQAYADVDGNIGWKPGGLAPVRPNWDGLLPVPGDGRYEWDGFRDQDQLPVEFNPERDWLATANEMNLPEDYPHEEHKLGFEWAEPFRAERIEEVLEEDPEASLQSSLDLQTDYLSIPARRVVSRLGGLATADPDLDQALRMLRGWDAVLDSGSAPAALFEVWFSSYLPQALLARTLTPAALEAVAPGDARVVLDLVESPDERLGPDPAAARDEALLSSLASAVARTRDLLGPDMAAWQWGSLHEAYFRHPLSGAVGADTRERIDVGPLPVGGNVFTVGNVGYGEEETWGAEDREHFRPTIGASWRMVLDVGEWDNSLAMNSPGQSGNPASPHYDDLFAPWTQRESFPLLYTRDAVEEATERKIKLVPRESGGDDGPPPSGRIRPISR
ncbi:MAG: penicillin acylase family protein [Rubrobacter sp.]|nr:penicillin acylase family protein [Rubrobacter sp.]